MAAATIGWQGHGPYLSLVGGIDDATGLVPWAIHEQEDAQGSFELLRAVVRRHGIPLAVYSLHRLGELMFDPEACRSRLREADAVLLPVASYRGLPFPSVPLGAYI